jgi:cephalosporin-C deacetylase-like acetyl esterase
MDTYSYPTVEPYFNLHLKETTRSWLRYAVDFPTAKPARNYEESNTGRGELFLPSKDFTGPLAILIHGWGGHSVIPHKLLAKALVKRGVASFILYLVFHPSRMPKALRDKGFHLTPDEWFEGYQTSVIETRQVVDWASSLRDTNKEQIAVIGISLGGIVAAISMGIDKRIGAGIFVVTGGNYENPAWLKRERDTRKEAEYSEAQERYARYLAEVAEKGGENVVLPKRSYLTDPLTFAGYLRKRPVMMINALWDESIPRQGALDLWEGCGKPAIRWFPSTHASIWLFYPLIRRQIVGFLGSTFGM